MSLNQKLFDLCVKWKCLNDDKENYAFGKKPFDKDKFVKLLKKTVVAIKEYRAKALDLDNHTTEIKKTMWDFAELITEIAIYGANTYVDKSECHIFSVSRVIAKALVLPEAAVSHCKLPPLDEWGVIHVFPEDFEVACPEGEDPNSEYWSTGYPYYANTGDMSKLMEIARRLLG